MHGVTQLVVTTSGLSNPIPLDRYVMGYSLSVTMATSATFTVQQSFDDPFAKYATSYNTNGVWMNSDDTSVVNASWRRTSNFSYPPRAVRINVTAGVSAGNPVTLTVIPIGTAE